MATADNKKSKIVMVVGAGIVSAAALYGYHYWSSQKNDTSTEKKQEIPYATLHTTGDKFPLVGLGTWNSAPGEVKRAVEVAIDAGYRHIDCAHIYKNEAEIGTAFAEIFDKKVARKDVWVTSKLWNNAHAVEEVIHACKNTLKNLQIDYLDLYLIHWPVAFKMVGGALIPFNEDGTVMYDFTPLEETWKKMEELVDLGLVRNIGLSNFNSQQIKSIMEVARIKPSVLQIECHPYFTQKPLIKVAKMHGMVVTAYSPFASPGTAKGDRPRPLDNGVIAKIAHKYKKTTAQVIVRFMVDRGISVIPKSVTPRRIMSNIDVADFTLAEEDMALIEGLNIDARLMIPKIQKGEEWVERDAAHPFFPFHLKY